MSTAAAAAGGLGWDASWDEPDRPAPAAVPHGGGRGVDAAAVQQPASWEEFWERVSAENTEAMRRAGVAADAPQRTRGRVRRRCSARGSELRAATAARAGEQSSV